MRTTLISYYTPDPANYYVGFAEELKKSCRKLQVPYFISEKKCTGSYLGNTRLKPSFIKEALTMLRCPVLWVDCDAELFRPIDEIAYLEKTSADFAVKYKPEGSPRKYHVGTMWFNFNESALRFLDYWIAKCEANPDMSDEAALELLRREVVGQEVQELPAQFFVLRQREAEVPHNAVIVHNISHGEMKKSEMAEAKRVSQAAGI